MQTVAAVSDHGHPIHCCYRCEVEAVPCCPVGGPPKLWKVEVRRQLEQDHRLLLLQAVTGSGGRQTWRCLVPWYGGPVARFSRGRELSESASTRVG